MKIFSKAAAAAALVMCASCAPAAELIGEQRATEAALGHASLEASQVQIAAFALLDQGGRAAYDLVFDTEDTGYRYLIDAESGEVLVNESHKRGAIEPDAVSAATGKPRATAPKNGSSVYEGEHIGAVRAKSIALTHADVNESDTRKLKMKKDRQYGRTVYKVEFKAGDREYEYDIDAATGTVMQWRREMDD